MSNTICRKTPKVGVETGGGLSGSPGCPVQHAEDVAGEDIADRRPWTTMVQGMTTESGYISSESSRYTTQPPMFSRIMLAKDVSKEPSVPGWHLS